MSALQVWKGVSYTQEITQPVEHRTLNFCPQIWGPPTSWGSLLSSVRVGWEKLGTRGSAGLLGSMASGKPPERRVGTARSRVAEGQQSTNPGSGLHA